LWLKFVRIFVTLRVNEISGEQLFVLVAEDDPSIRMFSGS
jgi:hypothetical protein